MRKLILFSLLILPASILTAQKKNHNGYIITNNGDTVNGYIEYKNWDFNPDKIIFKKDLSGTDENTFDVKDLCGFGIPGIDIYERYQCNISMDFTDINNLSTGPSYKKANQDIFLKRVFISPEIDFYIYRDNIKERYFIKEKKDSIPQELSYRVYYPNKNDNTSVKEEDFKNEILLLIDKYARGNESLKNSVSYLAYAQMPLKNILLRITNSPDNAKDVKGVKRSASGKTKFSFFLQGGINARLFKGKTLNSNNIPASPKSYSPVLGGGVDIVLNKFRDKFFIRLEINYASSKHEFKQKGTFSVFNTQQTSSFKEPILSLVPSFNFTLYNSAKVKLFLGLGIGYSVSPHVKNLSNTKYYDSSGAFAGEANYTIKDGANSELELNLLPGVIINNRFLITGAFILGGSYLKSNAIQLRVGYYLNNN